MFRRWLERAEFSVGGHVARWWVQQRPGGEPSSEDTLWEEDPEETAADLYAELCRLCGGKLTRALWWTSS